MRISTAKTNLNSLSHQKDLFQIPGGTEDVVSVIKCWCKMQSSSLTPKIACTGLQELVIPYRPKLTEKTPNSCQTKAKHAL